MATCGVILSGGDILDLDGTLLIQLLLFFVAFAVLRQLVFRPYVRLFEAREQATSGAKREAKLMERQAAEHKARYQSMMDDVRAQSQDARDKLRQEGLSLEKRVLDNVRREITSKTEEAAQELAHRGAAIRAEMQKAVPELAREMAERVLGRDLAGS